MEYPLPIVILMSDDVLSCTFVKSSRSDDVVISAANDFVTDDAYNAADRATTDTPAILNNLFIIISSFLTLIIFQF